MKSGIQPGDKKTHLYTVKEADIAAFELERVHPFFSTFALTREAEWSSRLFVHDIKEPDEEGIGTFVHIEHLSPALVGDEITFDATIKAMDNNEIICSIEARVGNRLVAKGETGQKVLKRHKLDKIMEQLLQARATD